MYSLGIDIGSSSVKVSLLEVETGCLVQSAQAPESEMAINSPKPGFAEQFPETWWKELQHAIRKLFASCTVNPSAVRCIGISYQMHGLIMTDHKGEVLRPAIIWCDSRAVEVGKQIAQGMGEENCYKNLMNLPGNFTSSRLKWVMQNEPEYYKKCENIFLPGDWILYKMTGEKSTTIAGLTEGIFWNFSGHTIDKSLITHMGIPETIIPPFSPVFGIQGQLHKKAAEELGLCSGTPITYRCGDQPNNAFSLNVLHPGEIAATAGTSGVVYAVTDRFNPESGKGVNVFAHVNHEKDKPRLGILLCINGVGIANSWVKKNMGGKGIDYDEMNMLAKKIPPGSNGLCMIPFGNGAERMLDNRHPGASFHGLNFNIHNEAAIYHATHEGIAFSFYYGIKKMQEAGLEINVIRAGKENLFKSEVFVKTLAGITGTEIQLYNTNGAGGAARGAALGAGLYQNDKACFTGLQLVETIVPEVSQEQEYRQAYSNWAQALQQQH